MYADANEQVPALPADGSSLDETAGGVSVGEGAHKTAPIHAQLRAPSELPSSRHPVSKPPAEHTPGSAAVARRELAAISSSGEPAELIPVVKHFVSEEQLELMRILGQVRCEPHFLHILGLLRLACLARDMCVLMCRGLESLEVITGICGLAFMRYCLAKAPESQF
jgi:hypothetical protein